MGAAISGRRGAGAGATEGARAQQMQQLQAQVRELDGQVQELREQLARERERADALQAALEEERAVARRRIVKYLHDHYLWAPLTET